MGKTKEQPEAKMNELQEMRKLVSDLSAKLEKETRARALIDTSSNAQCILDKHGIICQCNKTLSQYFGLSPEQMSGTCIFDYLPEAETAERKQGLVEVFQSASPVSGDTSIFNRSVKYYVHPLPDKTGEITHVAVHAYDNTVHKNTSRQLRENEEIFTRFLENSPIYVFFKDEEIRAVKLSKNYEKMLGMPMQEIIGKNMHELFPSELAEQMVNDDLRVLRERKTVTVREVLNDRHYETIKFPVIIDDEPKFLAGYTIDTTKQVHAEKTLRESEERFKKVYSEGTLPIAMLNGNFRFLSVNQVFQDTFGYKESELRKMTFRDITHPEHIDHDIENLQLLLQKKTDLYQTEKRYITKNNEIVWGKAQVSIVYDSSGKFLYFLVMINDITSYKLAEQQIIQKNLELVKLNAEKDKFFSIIAHDLRSPFNTFLGLTEIMAEDLYSLRLEEIQQIATDLKNSANNLYHLLENLLEWSMVKRGIKPFNPKEIVLNKLAADTLASKSESIRMKSIRTTMHIPANIRVTADEHMLGTIIRNLLSNAVKFTPKNGNIDIKAVVKNGTTELTIADSGIGMDEKMKKTLFDLTGSNNRPGTEGELSTGLGLLLCKEFIEIHNGTIRVESEPEKGSSFIIELNR